VNREPVIELTGIRKTYLLGTVAVEVLRGIDLTVNRGDFLAIMGPSGSGKSTLMNLIGLLDRPDEGSYLLEGHEVGTQDDDRRSYYRNHLIGFIFQNFNLLPRATALRNVMLPLLYRPMPDEERRDAATRALESVGLGRKLRSLPTQLSGGERQRVAIARALVGSPTVILADEPTGNLDQGTGGEIMGLLTDIVHRGETVIMVTHDPTIAEQADRITRVIDGSIVDE